MERDRSDLWEMGLAQNLKICVRESQVSCSWHYGKDLPKQTVTSFAALQGSFQGPCSTFESLETVKSVKATP